MKKNKLLILISTLFMITACGETTNGNQKNITNQGDEGEYIYYENGYYYIREALKSLTSATCISEKIELEATKESLTLKLNDFDIVGLNNFGLYGHEVIEESVTFYDEAGVAISKIHVNYDDYNEYDESERNEIEMIQATMPGEVNDDGFYLDQRAYMSTNGIETFTTNSMFSPIPDHQDYKTAYKNAYNSLKFNSLVSIANMLPEIYTTKVKGNEIIIEESNGGYFDNDENPYFNPSLPDKAEYLTYFNKTNSYTVIEKVNDKYFLKKIGYYIESYLAYDYDGSILREPRYLSSTFTDVVLEYEEQEQYETPKELKPIVDIEYAPYVVVSKKNGNEFINATGTIPYNITDLYNEVYKDNPYEVYEFAINADANDAFTLINADESGATFTFESNVYDEELIEVNENYHEEEYHVDCTQIVMKDFDTYYFNIFVDKETHKVVKVTDGVFASFIRPVETLPLPPM